MEPRNKNKLVLLVIGALVIAGVVFAAYSVIIKTQNSQQLVGNDRDAHGCIGSAGYSWCEVKQKCLRVWEERCEDYSPLDSEAKAGFIEGDIMYPSGNSQPFQTVCAVEPISKKQFCTNKDNLVTKNETCNLQDWENHMGEEIARPISGETCIVGGTLYVGYKLKVPVGKYYVYSLRGIPTEFKGFADNFVGYYSEFVTCGLKYNCSSHEPIITEVIEGKTVSHVDLFDWYAN